MTEEMVITVDALITKLRGISLGGYGDATISIRNAMPDQRYPIVSISPNWDLEECVLRIETAVLEEPSKEEPQIMPSLELTLREAEARAFHALIGATNYTAREQAVLHCEPCVLWSEERDDLLRVAWDKLDDVIAKRERA